MKKKSLALAILASHLLTPVSPVLAQMTCVPESDFFGDCQKLLHARLTENHSAFASCPSWAKSFLDVVSTEIDVHYAKTWNEIITYFKKRASGFSIEPELLQSIPAEHREAFQSKFAALVFTAKAKKADGAKLYHDLLTLMDEVAGVCSAPAAPAVETTTTAPVVIETTPAPVVIETTTAPVVIETTTAPVVIETTTAPVVIEPTPAPEVKTTPAPVVVEPTPAPEVKTTPAPEVVELTPAPEVKTTPAQATVKVGEQKTDAYLDFWNSDAFRNVGKALGV